MKIGIIGAENSHTGAIARIINVDKLVKGFSVDFVWGETKELAQKAATVGAIPNIVSHPEQMLEKINAVIVDHRHPMHHLKAVSPFVEKGIPTFVDKPFCYRVAEGREFLELAKKHCVPVTSFSILPHQESFLQFVRLLKDAGDIKSATTYGPCDINSEYGGIFFYGIHQVDVVLNAFGYDVVSVQVATNGENATGQLFYKNGLIVTMNLIKSGIPNFKIDAAGTTKFIQQPLDFDKNHYLTGIKVFTKMFKDGEEPLSREQMLKPVQVLEALEKSVKSVKREKIED